MKLVFACFLVITICTFAVLTYMNQLKLKTFFDMMYTSRPSTSPIKNPVVYQLNFISNSEKIWTFKISNTFISDWEKNRVNALMISGAIYNITDVMTVDNMMKLTLVSDCTNTLSFAGCEASPGEPSKTLYVLAYKF